jgi:hypothetical protein
MLANAGAERFRGAEAELKWRFAAYGTLLASYSYHDTRFGDTITVEAGNTVQLDGRQLNLSPHGLAAFGLAYTPPAGLQASTQLAYVGRRFLDRLNAAPIGGYKTIDAHPRTLRAPHGRARRLQPDRPARPDINEFGDQSYYCCRRGWSGCRCSTTCRFVHSPLRVTATYSPLKGPRSSRDSGPRP